MSFIIKEAEREQIKIKMGISSPSGFGKTYSALLLAKGLCGGDLSKVCVIDTENRSASLYSHLGKYKVIDFEAPYTPERYIEALSMVIKNGFEVCVIDSITHSWDGTGGFLEIHEKATKAMKIQNSFMAWSQVTPRYKKFIDAILQSNIHVICCSRRKQEYEQTEINGRKVVQKIGTKEINREGFEYELSINFEIQNAEHYANSSKDRTMLFPASESFIITEDTGLKIKNWIESGAVLVEDNQVKEAIPDSLEQTVCKMLDYLQVLGVTEEIVLAKINKINIQFIDEFDLEQLKFIIQGAKDLCKGKNKKEYAEFLLMQFVPPVKETEQNVTMSEMTTDINNGEQS